MDKYHPRQPQSYPYQPLAPTDNLARQIYPPPAEPAPAESSVVPLAPTGRSPEAPPSPRPPEKRHTTSTKSRSTKTKAKTLRPSNLPVVDPLTDELQRLEAWADRINQILAERSRTTPPLDPAPPAPLKVFPVPTYGSPSLHAATPPLPPDPPENDPSPATLHRQAAQIQQRLATIQAQLASLQAEPTAPPPPAPARPDIPPLAYASTSYPGSPPNGSMPQPQPPDHPPQSLAPIAPSASLRPPYPPSVSAFAPPSSADAWMGQAAQFLEPPLAPPQGDRPRLPAPERNSPRPRPRFSVLTVPPKFSDRLQDAGIWLMTAIALRISAQVLIVTVPALAPIVNLLLLTPIAGLAGLILFLPKAGWVPYYRVLLLLAGLFIGGKV